MWRFEILSGLARVPLAVILCIEITMKLQAAFAFVLTSALIRSCAYLISPAYAEPIKIGVIAPLTGAAAELGSQIRNGLLLLEDDLDGKVKFLFEDEACEAKTALTAAQKLTTTDKVPVIIGPLCSPPMLSIAPLLNRAGVAFIHTSSGTQNTLAKKGPLGIEGTGTVMQENAQLTQFILGQGFDSAAIIHFEQEWASGHAKAFNDSFTEHGGKIVSKEAFVNVNENDFRLIILRVKATFPKVVFIVAFNGQTGTILKQLRSLGVTAPVFAQYDVEDPAFLAAAGQAADGVRYAYPFDNINYTESARKFRSRYLKRFGHEPSFYPYNGYDIGQVTVKATQKCGNDSACIHSFIVNTKNFEGLTGALSFSTDGAVNRKFIMKEVRNGRFEKLPD